MLLLVAILNYQDRHVTNINLLYTLISFVPKNLCFDTKLKCLCSLEGSFNSMRDLRSSILKWWHWMRLMRQKIWTIFLVYMTPKQASRKSQSSSYLPLLFLKEILSLSRGYELAHWHKPVFVGVHLEIITHKETLTICHHYYSQHVLNTLLHQ